MPNCGLLSAAPVPAVQSAARAIADEQSYDTGLWFVAETATEAHLQAALRRLAAAVEGEAPVVRTPLTDEKVWMLATQCTVGSDLHIDKFARAIEAAHGIGGKVEPVAHTIIAGALFDFMGYLTSRAERIVLSASDDASPAIDAIRDFAKKRGLSLDDALVREWIDELSTAPTALSPSHRSRPRHQRSHNMIKLPKLPDHLNAQWPYLPHQLRARDIEVARAALEAAAQACNKRAQEAYVRYRSEGSAYDDGGCDMGNTLEFDLRALRIEGETT
jgi:hypothetical protein